MADIFEYATNLYKLLKEDPKIYISPNIIPVKIDPDDETVLEYKDDLYGYINFKPPENELLINFKKFKNEFRNHKYRDGYNINKIISRHLELFTPLLDKYHDISISREMRPLHNGIEVYYSEGMPGDSRKIDNLFKELPIRVLKIITDYCKMQKIIINNVIEIAKNSIDQQQKNTVINKDSVEIPQLDPNDDRIYMGMPLSEIRDFFSFLSQETKHERRIMSEDDLEYFLNMNFSGFPRNTISKEITFNLIGNVDFQYIIFHFYNKFNGPIPIKRNKWAELLKNSFPSKFNGTIDNIAKNFKDNFLPTSQKLNALGLSHPLT